MSPLVSTCSHQTPSRGSADARPPAARLSGASWPADVGAAYVAGIVAAVPLGLVARTWPGAASPQAATAAIAALMAMAFTMLRVNRRSAWRVRRRMRMARSGVLLVVLACWAISGCGDQATSPSPVLMTDTFTGTLQVLGTDAKTFTVSYGLTTSDASVSVTALTTVANGTALSTTIGVAFGSIAFDGSCQRSSAYTATAAKLGQELVATGAFIAGTYCVQLFDSGTLTEPTTYSVTVKHY